MDSHAHASGPCQARLVPARKWEINQGVNTSFVSTRGRYTDRDTVYEAYVSLLVLERHDNTCTVLINVKSGYTYTDGSPVTPRTSVEHPSGWTVHRHPWYSSTCLPGPLPVTSFVTSSPSRTGPVVSHFTGVSYSRRSHPSPSDFSPSLD